MSVNAMYSILLKKENAHDDPIYCCDWVKCNTSGDSAKALKDLIVTGGLDGLVKVWGCENNRLELLHTLEGHTMGIVSVVISPNATTIVSASLDSHLILWNLNSGKKITEVPIGETDVWKVTFSPDSEEMATGGHTGKVYVYGVKEGVLDKVLDTREKIILSLDWSPNGRYIAGGSDEGNVCILDMVQDKVLHTIKAHTQAVRSVAFSQNSKLLATASNDGYVKIYIVVGAALQCKVEHKSWIVSVCFTPDGSRVAYGAADGTVRIALSKDLTVLNKFQEHSDTVWGVHFDSNSKKLISVSKDGCINLYECPPFKK